MGGPAKKCVDDPAGSNNSFGPTWSVRYGGAECPLDDPGTWGGLGPDEWPADFQSKEYGGCDVCDGAVGFGWALNLNTGGKGAADNYMRMYVRRRCTCQDKECGDDGCGNSCGDCGPGSTCCSSSCLSDDDLQDPAKLYVPCEYPTIQAAVTAASSGSQVIVLPGTYVEQVDVEGKKVHLSSLNGPESTTIKWDVPGVYHGIVNFKSGSNGSSISGFEIVAPENPGPESSMCVFVQKPAKNVTIDGNIMHFCKMGGCFYHHSTSGVCRNNLIVDSFRAAWCDGGAVCTFFNNTFARTEEGLWTSQATAVMKNNIFYEVASDWSYGKPTLENNLTTSNWPTANGNISGDPMFVDPDNNDFHLLPGSPAIDAGVALPGVTDDMDGVPRPQGAGFDIGPYEYVE